MTDALSRLTAALSDRYTIERELGSGGMATVYLAEDLKHHRKVAIKVLRPELAAALGAERFHREIEIAANLNHPHILPLLDSGTAEEQTSDRPPVRPSDQEPTALPPDRPTAFLYYVMPYIEGESLRDRLAREGELPIAEAVRILRDVVDALSHAHKHSVVHRDIKPDNVMLTERHALVTDFGVAKAVSDATGRHQLTTEGVALGTPAYMSPEQAAADPHIDHRADIYSVGVIAYELLTGRTPFIGNTQQELLAAHVTQTPDPVTRYRESIPPALAELVMKCLEKKAADRWQTTEELLPKLEALATPSGGTTPVGTVPISAMKRSRKILIGVSAVAVVLAAMVVAISMPRGGGVALDPERIVVAVFRNETGDPSLDHLGRQAGHGITQGIRGAGEFVRFTPWEVALQSAQYVQGEVDAGRVRDVVRALAEETGSGTVISGAYYHEGDSIRFQVDVTDAVSGSLVGSPEPVLGSRQAPSELVGHLQQRVMGFLAMAFDERFAASAERVGRLPTFEAYQAFDEGMDVLVDQYSQRGALPHFLRAFELDSTFFTALIYACIPVFNLEEIALADSLMGLLGAHADQLSEYDRHWLRFWQGMFDGDPEASLQSITSAAQIAPQSRASYLRSYLLEILNRPREELEVLAAIEPDRGGMRGTWMYWIRVIIAHDMLGEHVQELDVARRARIQYPDVIRFPYYEAEALVALGRVDDARQLLAEVGMWSTDRYIGVGQELRVYGHIEAAREVFYQAVEWERAQPPEEAARRGNRLNLAEALYHVEEWHEAREIAEELVAEFPDGVNNLGLLGVILARLGDRERALHVSEQLAAMDNQFGVPQHIVWRARIAAAVGDNAAAVRLLAEAFRRGSTSLQWWVGRLVEFESLRDHPGFQEFMRPKG